MSDFPLHFKSNRLLAEYDSRKGVANEMAPSEGATEKTIMDLLIATRNTNKLREIRALFQASSLRLLNVDDLPSLPEVEEDGATFEDNAAKKARTLAIASGHWAMADDSGLEVEALDGAPGVYSARYAGEPPDYAANNRHLLAELSGNPNRAARFVCVIALASPDGHVATVRGTCAGCITTALRGKTGFGYDPLFIPEGHTRTFAEMNAEEKNAISHRGRALLRAREAWGQILA